MNLPYMLKNWAKISGLSEDGETKSSEVEKVILCAYNSLLHSFCRSPQTHLVSETTEEGLDHSSLPSYPLRVLD